MDGFFQTHRWSETCSLAFNHFPYKPFNKELNKQQNPTPLHTLSLPDGIRPGSQTFPKWKPGLHTGGSQARPATDDDVFYLAYIMFLKKYLNELSTSKTQEIPYLIYVSGFS